MYKDKMYNIFLCYRRGAGSQGSLLAARLYDELGSIEDFKPFYAPQVVEPGDNFRQVSLNAIAGVKVFILLLIPGFFDECSNDDDPVRAEIQTALDDQHIRFIPICLPGFDAAQEFTKSVRACFQGAFADRIEHIAYAQCSDPKSFNVADVLEKPIRKLFCLYDDEKREQGASTTQTKGEDIADDRLTIENGVLSKCDEKAKGDLIIPYGVTSIGGYAFRGCRALTSITIPDGVTSIGGSAFAYCTSLTSVTIGDSVTSIGDYAFSNCSSLTSVTIGNSVTSIGIYAFGYCDSLTSVTIGNGVTSIGDSAFANCYSLTSVIIPDSVTSIEDSAFSGCDSLTSITIPDSVTSIEDSAFAWCTSLTSVAIGNGVTSIGSSAFSDCTSLTSVAIPDSVTSIGSSAFANCYSLISVIIPDSVTSIGSSAFYDCDSLTSVTIPDSVTSIGYHVFYGCDSLTSVTFDGTMAEWGAVDKDPWWHDGCPFTEVECSDGSVSV